MCPTLVFPVSESAVAMETMDGVQPFPTGPVTPQSAGPEGGATGDQLVFLFPSDHTWFWSGFMKSPRTDLVFVIHHI